MSNVFKILERRLVAEQARQAKVQQPEQGDRWQGLVTALAGELDRMMQAAAAPSADLAARLQRLELATAHQNSSAGLEARLTRLETAMQETQAPGTELAARLASLEQDAKTHQATTGSHVVKLGRLERGVESSNSSFFDLTARLYDLETAQTGQTTAAAHPEAPQNAAPQKRRATN